MGERRNPGVRDATLLPQQPIRQKPGPDCIAQFSRSSSKKRPNRSLASATTDAYWIKSRQTGRRISGC
ncbi:MAG: hypothetical protein CMJ47_14065 [Planctomyces sp.]|nr:hypothetical protein [Planctomyces sp.]